MNDIKDNIWDSVRDNYNYLKAAALQKTARERIVHTRLFVLLSNLITNSQYIIIEINL